MIRKIRGVNYVPNSCRTSYPLTPEKLVDLNNLLSYYEGSTTSLVSLKYEVVLVRVFNEALVFEDNKGVVRSVRPKPSEDYRMREIYKILTNESKPDDIIPLSDAEVEILKPLIKNKLYKEQK